ncbi:hypothetical protein WOLCODRAFT_27345 [Wolfiporia cocos MD-104 SS10]|uniref:Uncharacterized protein n=1 Tax=Wolfiporia cocos (strain MD-104) TaxID=742152 RepID=A0A2H3JAE7_WOLCO|nr:hypothetical protein WOLCODRAFT_27345 [Wolfiporia cocos MD-104 SS10]
MGRLSGPDDPVFIPQFANDKLMLRILLIGHKEYRHQFNVYRTVGRKKQPITRAMLAHKMAKELEIYLKPTNKVVDRSSPDAAHALGPIDLKHILISGVDHVAQGSVQLDLALLRV